MGQNDVSILLKGLSKQSEANLKVTSKAIRKRDREVSPDVSVSTNGASSSVNSNDNNGFGNKAMKYLDRMLSQNELEEEKDEEVTFISESNPFKEEVYDVESEDHKLAKYFFFEKIEFKSYVQNKASNKHQSISKTE